MRIKNKGERREEKEEEEKEEKEKKKEKEEEKGEEKEEEKEKKEEKEEEEKKEKKEEEKEKKRKKRAHIIKKTTQRKHAPCLLRLRLRCVSTLCQAQNSFGTNLLNVESIPGPTTEAASSKATSLSHLETKILNPSCHWTLLYTKRLAQRQERSRCLQRSYTENISERNVTKPGRRGDVSLSTEELNYNRKSKSSFGKWKS
ncbi:hypothetical protein STEG23_006808 [Scotinomys teguina]